MLRNDIFYYMLRNESYHWEAPDQAALILKMEAAVTQVCAGFVRKKNATSL